MANKQIRYGIGFDIDKSGLQIVKSELASLQKMSYSEFSLISDENLSKTRGQFEAIKRDVKALENAIDIAFNPKLDTVNIDKFNQSIKNLDLKRIEQSFSSMGIKGKKAFVDISQQLLTTKTELKQTSKLLDSIATTLGNTVKWSIASGAINNFTSSIRKAWSFTKSLDSSLNDIRIVTEKSADDMDKFAVKANKAAKALGSATTAYTKASLIYYQQGLNEEDVQARTDVTIKAANVTGQSAAEVSEQLTAVWNGYKVVASEAELYVDKLSAVAATTAADLQELSEGMSKVASGANAMGVDIDQLTAQLSTIVSVTRQDASSVGTALKTIFARMGDLKVDGVDEFGVSLGEVSGTLKQVGIEVLDQEGNLRDMGTVMEEVAGKWGTWTEAQQQAIAVAMAGKRQYNNLLALFENWDMYESALATSRGSAGTLQKQQDIYMESIEARLQRLSTAGEKVYNSFFDSDSMKTLIDSLTYVTDQFSDFIRAIGGGGNLLLGLGGIATKVFNTQISTSITRIISNLKIAKDSQLQYNAQLEMQQNFANLDNDAYQKMAEIKKFELANAERLTAEEKEKLKILIEQTAELEKQRIDREAKVASAEEYVQDYGEGGLSNKQVLNRLKGDTFIDEITGEEKRKRGGKRGSIEVLSTEVNKAKKSKETSRASVFSALEIDKDDTASENKKKKSNLVLKAANKEIEKLQNLATSNKVSVTTKEQAKIIIESTENISEKKERLIALLEDEVDTQKRVVQSLEEGEQAQSDYNRSSEAIQDNVENLKKTADTRKIVEGFTSLAGGAMQAASAVTMLVNGFKSLEDDSLTPWEKFSTLLTTIISAAPMLIMAFGGIKKGLITLAPTFKAVGNEGAIMWGKILGPIALIIAGIAAVIVIIALLKNAFDAAADDGTKALEQARKGAESLKDELNRVKNANEELKKSFEDYDKAQEAIENMIKGTDEWKQAIQDANMQILDLIDKYPELAQYISDVDGQLKVSEEGRELVLKKSNDAVLQATRNSILGNINVLEKKNSQIAQKGSTEILSHVRNRYGTEYTAQGLEKERDFAYEKAIEIVNKKGNAILDNSYEKFEKAMKEAGVTEENLIKTLYEHGEELGKSAAAVAANTAAINLQNKQIASSYLEENSELYQNAEQNDKDVLAAIFAQETSISSQAYQDALKKYERGNGDITEKDAKEFADEYAEMMNIDAAKTEVKDGYIVYTDINGKETKVEMNVAGQALAQKDAQDAANDPEALARKIETLNKAQSISNKVSSNISKANLERAISTLVAGKESTDLSGLSEKDLADSGLASVNSQDLRATATALGYGSIEELNAAAIELGYDSGEAYAQAIETSIKNYKYEKDRLTVGLSDSVKSAFNTLNTVAEGQTKSFLSQFSLATQKGITESLQNAFEKSGKDGVEALRDFYAGLENSLSEEDIAAISNVASKIDWTSSSGIAEFRYELSKLGIDPDTIQGFDTFVNKMDDFVNVVNEVRTNLDGLQQKLQQFGEITKDLSLGDIIIKEDYDNLIKYNTALADYFVLTADGYKYIGGAEEEFKQTQKEILDPEKIKQQFANGELQANATKTLFNSGAISIEDRRKEVQELINTGKADDFLAASGINTNTFAEYSNILSGVTTKTLGDKNFKLKDLAKMSADDLAEQAGISKENAQKVIDDAKERTETANDYINQAFANINSSYDAIENGTWNDDMNKSITLSVSGLANNYDELKAYRNTMDASEYNKLAKLLLTEEATDLGVNIDLWNQLSNSLPLEEQEAYLNNVRKLQAYNEIDYYKTLNDTIEDLNDNYSDLQNEQEKLSGKALIDNLKEQANLQKQIVAAEDAKLLAKKEQWALERERIKTDLSGLVSAGILGAEKISYNEDGTISDTTRDAIANAVLNATGKEKNMIQSVLDSVDTFNDEVESGIEEHADAIREAYQNQADLMIEAFNQELQLHIDLNDAKKEWEEFSHNMYDGEGMRFFDEESALDSINGALERAEYIKDSFDRVNDAMINATEARQMTLDGMAGAQAFQTSLEEAEANRLTVEQNSKTQIENYQNEIDAIKENNATLEQEKEALVAQKSTLEEEKNQKQSVVDEKLAKKNQAALVNDAMQTMIEKNNNMLIDAAATLTQANLTKATEKYNTAYAELENTTTKITEASNQIEAKEAAIVAGNTRIDELEESIEAENQKINNARERERAAKEARNNYISNLISGGARYTTQNADGNMIVNEAQYQEDMKDWLSDAQDYYEELQEEAQNIYDAYLKSQEEIMAAYDKQIEKLSSINGILSSQANLMKLVGKNAEGNGAKIATLYSTMRANVETNYGLAKGQLSAAQEEYNKIIALGDQATKEQIETVTANLQTATENVLSMAQEYATALADEYGAALKGIIDDYLKEIAGADLESITQNWEMATQKEEKYVDEINSQYAINELNRKYQTSIDETDNYAAQKKLADARAAQEEKLNKILQERGKLSQYELDRANAEYELTLKQIALEEAQQTASKMKLTRDASGNYSYQYVQDADAVAGAQAELEAAQNELYNLDKERNKNLVDEYYSIMQEAQDKMSEAVAAGDQERLTALQEHYFGTNGLLSGIQNELGIASENLDSIGETLGGENWTSPFKDFTDAIAQSDLSKLTEEVSTLTTNTSSYLTAAASEINTLLNSPDGALTMAVSSLNNEVAKGINGIGTIVADAKDASTLALEKLGGEDGLLATMTTLGDSLKSLGDQYYNYLEGQVNRDNAITANTAALERNTLALTYLAQLQDNDTTNDAAASAGLQELLSTLGGQQD